MRRGPEAQMRLRSFSCHRCSCWLRHRCSCWLRCWVSAGCATGVPGAVGPARSPSAPRASLGASVRSPPVPSGPSGALHTSGAGCVAVLLRGVACGPAGVPGAVWCVGGPGCSMRPWAAARPLTVRAASFARCVVSKLGQALRPRRRPPHWWLMVR